MAFQSQLRRRVTPFGAQAHIFLSTLAVRKIFANFVLQILQSLALGLETLTRDEHNLCVKTTRLRLENCC